MRLMSVKHMPLELVDLRQLDADTKPFGILEPPELSLAKRLRRN